MTYSCTGHGAPNQSFIYEKKSKKLLRMFAKRGPNRLADMLIIKSYENSPKRIEQYTQEGKLVIKWEDFYDTIINDYPEFLL